MKEDKRMNSIARRINRYWIRRTILILALMDIALGSMVAASWIDVNVGYFWAVLGGAEVLLVLLQGRAHLKPTEGGDFRQAVYRAVRNALMGAKSTIHSKP